MSNDERQLTPGQKRKDEPEERSDKGAVGTEAAQAGGIEPAKQQAQRDWENSSKQSGE